MTLPGVTRILLVRHGATTASAEDRFAGSSDVELSEEGIGQVKRLAERLRGTPIAAAYCSSMRRALVTAQLLAEPHGLTPIIEPALREIAHGPWEGLTREEIERRFADDYAAWSKDPFNTTVPGGENARTVLERALPVIERIVRNHAGQTVLIVSHKATIRVVIATLMDMDPRRYRDRLAQDLACLNILDFRDPRDAKLMLLNDTSHCA